MFPDGNVQSFLNGNACRFGNARSGTVPGEGRGRKRRTAPPFEETPRVQPSWEMERTQFT